MEIVTSKTHESNEPDNFITKRLLFTCLLVVANGGFHFGYQISIINPLGDVLQDFVISNLKRRYKTDLSSTDSAFVWSFVVSSLLLGATMGALLVAKILTKYGHQNAIMLSALIHLSSSCFCVSSSFLKMPELFLLGRLTAGVGVGMSATVQGTFITEISPVQLRGFTGSFGGLSTNVGYITAAIIGMPMIFGNAKTWFIAFLLEALPSVLVICIAPFWLKESPVFSLKQGETEKAFDALQVYCGVHAIKEFSRIQSEVKMNDAIDGLWDIIRNKGSRNALLLSSTLNAVVSFSGIVAMSFFGTYLLKSIGFSNTCAAIANCLASLAGTCGAIVAIVFMDRVGRRPLIIGGLFILAIMNTLMMALVFAYHYNGDKSIGWIFLVVFAGFLFIFSAAIGPASWFIGSELSTNSARSTTQAASIAVQYLTCFLCPLLFYSLLSSAGSLCFLLFIIPLLLSTIYFQRNLPETKGKSQIEIENSLQAF